MENNSFYIKAKGEKHIYHRVEYSEVIMCDTYMSSGVKIHRQDKPYLWVEATVETLYDLFFRRNREFIRASSHYIVNVNHIVSAEMRSDSVKLILSEKKEAILRNGHDYNYFIQNNRRRDEEVIQDTPEKDAIILEDAGVVETIQKIKEATGETIPRKYIVKRFKELSL